MTRTTVSRGLFSAIKYESLSIVVIVCLSDVHATYRTLFRMKAL